MIDISDLRLSQRSASTMELQASTSIPPTRRPLQTIPTMPLNKRPLPITTNSSPLDTMHTLQSVAPMTPPSTPIRPQCKRSSTSAGTISLVSLDEEDTDSPDHDLAEAEEGPVQRELTWVETIPRPYAEAYKLEDTSTSRHAEYGRGVWSVVYRAHEVTPTSSALPTPPNSPVSGPKANTSQVALAVKSPSRRDAHNILYHEARVLTYLHSIRNSSTYIVPFHGYELSTHSIVLEPFPLNLDSYTKAAAASARTNFSTQTMFDPIVGLPEWSTLATHLITGLSFLHANKCIHGDIKPANILLRPTPSGLHEPLYCDFSSSLHTHDPTPTEITALTADYSAPELLSSLTSSGVPTLPSSAADVYALGVTLLFAALGESPYAAARMEVMKLSMAKEGRPLDFAMGGDQGARVRKGSAVERCLMGAVRKEEERWGVEEWVEVVKKNLYEETAQKA